MMDMQEVKERRPHSVEEDNEQEQKEADPMVPNVSTPQRSLPESWLTFVLDRIWAVAFLTVASFGLYEAHFVSDLLHAPHANRTFVHLGIFFGTLLGLFGCYIEVYRSMILGEQVHYESAKTATHGMLVSMLASGFCLAVGMWPVWHWLTLPYLIMWSWGVVLQLLVILPPILQRVVFVGGYLWFMHSYLSMLMIQ
ncbi:putative membrane protein [Phytophthora megakarya]|uniref:Putative membrane protein n=1 Tax=Phytophthora megakarya TaxID=4795 RepID=A0A225V698_9STRA|nr:putative membrane protein [Phytophthora megakarya]